MIAQRIFLRHYYSLISGGATRYSLVYKSGHVRSSRPVMDLLYVPADVT